MKPADDSTPPLLFDWQPLPRHWPRLIKWLLLTLTGMAGFFYCFRVIYPQSQGLAPVPQQITLISAEDPAVRTLLHRVQDRDFAIMPDTTGGAPALRLEDLAPLFHPTFEKREFQLQDLPHKISTVPPPRLMDFTAPVLPAMDLSALKPVRTLPVEAVGKPTLALIFSANIAGRKITHAPDFDALALTDPEAWRFHIGVVPGGRVSVALPIAVGEQTKLTAALVAKLSELRFEPVPQKNADIEWSNVTFRWSEPTP